MEEFPDGGKNNNVDLAPAQTDEIDGCGWADKQSDRDSPSEVDLKIKFSVE